MIILVAINFSFEHGTIEFKLVIPVLLAGVVINGDYCFNYFH